MSNAIERVLGSLSQHGDRGSLLSENTQIIKDKIGRRSEVGFLNGIHINDVLSATDEIRNGFRQNGRQVVDLHSQIRNINPRVAINDEEDPFI